MLIQYAIILYDTAKVKIFMATVAQQVRALVCGTGGRGFETHQSPQISLYLTFLLQKYNAH